MLIGEDKITLPSTDGTIELSLGGENVATNAIAADTAIMGYLQSVPKPKATSATYFTVVIESNGDVTATAPAPAPAPTPAPTE
jgi:hypothetical protein